ncbi:hypothetical protein AKJ40_02380 [candidate division MSBL1 archaeon SCGC-AAA259M10]|uniref:NADH:ubiquinone oxidoreductase 30kDa subunit domain-containing protein n=1 Tax=candidate division MSBL1 archaeon SCGC-AAA259M10 TaxID=1698270 RepID=A0A133V043_9EURY|nr:hypothetical protein AKJ40_02380 [candidate division MSBL1 archaeon SCGC-AAA259M10]
MSDGAKGIKTGQVREVESKELKDVAEELLEEGFDHLESLTGVDRPEDGQIELIYHVSSYSDSDLREQVIVVKTRVDRETPEIRSLSDFWPNIRYMEAETRDLLGVRFKGNKLRAPLLLPDELEGEYPLRKDFEIPEEGIK